MPSLMVRGVESLRLRHDRTSCGRGVEGGIVQGWCLLDLFLCHAFNACIRGMSCERDVRLLKPVVEGLGMNAKQTSSVCDRKKSHTQNSFQEKSIGKTTRAQISRNSGTSQKFLGSLGNECCQEQSREQCCESQPGLASL